MFRCALFNPCFQSVRRRNLLVASLIVVLLFCSLFICMFMSSGSIWKPVDDVGVYTLTVYYGFSSSPEVEHYRVGDTVSLYFIPEQGDYKFAGWIVNEGDITLPLRVPTVFTMPASNVVLTATWAHKDGSISYTPTSSGNISLSLDNNQESSALPTPLSG